MRCWVCFTESTQYLVDKIFYDHRWFFQRKLILTASSTGKFLQNSCSEQLFRKLTGRSASVHKKNSTTDILLGVINEHFGLKKMVWYDKYMGPFKMCITQEKVTKSDVGEGFATNECEATHSKKTRFCEWCSF